MTVSGLSRIRLYIATSEGPVRVQRILAEDAVEDSEPSAVCLNGTYTRLGITKGYTWFVRDHVRSVTGKGVYRMDLDARIDGGDSWMLGVWICHALLHEGRLAMHDDEAEITIFATGAVAFGAGADRTLEIRKVGHITDKVRLMAALMAEEAAAGRRVVFLAPRDNADEAKAELEKLPAAIRETLSFHDVAEMEEVRSLIGLAEPGGNRPSEVTSTEQPETAVVVVGPPARRARGALLLALVALLAGGAAAGGYAALRSYEDDWRTLWQQGRYVDLVAALDAAPLGFMADRFRAMLGAGTAVPIAVRARRPEDGGSCAGLRFRSGLMADKQVAPAPGRPATGALYVLDDPSTLCGFVVRAGAAPGSAEGSAPGRLWLALVRDNGEGAREAILPSRRLTSGDGATGSVTLTQDLPLYRRESWSWRVLALRTPGPSADLARMFEENPADFSVDTLDALTTLGIVVSWARIGLAELRGGRR